MQGFASVAVNLALIAFMLTTCLPDEVVAEYSFRCDVCKTARRLTNGIQHVANGFSGVINKAFNDDNVAYLRIAFDLLSRDKASSTAWLNLDSFFASLHGPTVAYSTFGVSVIYLVDELCLSSEIQQSFERHSHLQLRLNGIRNAFFKEETLILEFASRLSSDSPFAWKASDLEILKNVQNLVKEVKGLLGDIHREISIAHSQKMKAEEQTVATTNIGALGGALLLTGTTILTGGVSLPMTALYVTAGAGFGGLTGMAVGYANIRATTQLLQDLQDLKTQAEELYKGIDKVHHMLLLLNTSTWESYRASLVAYFTEIFASIRAILT
ncbi:uncharacterized protein [Ptychodera flava]|uniref:uncharacterized protein n=1 Tax=Ptychodera flava TaxID=63121 RepID=UPI003969D5C7